MKIIVLSNTGLRLDSTSVYFIKAFKKLLGEDNVEHLQTNEQIMALNGNEADHYMKIDDGQSWTTFNPKLHPSSYYCIDTHIETDWRLKVASECKIDNMFVAHKEGLTLPWHTSNVTWVSVGAELESHCVGPKTKLYDVCFLGNFHSQFASARIEYVDALFKHVPNFYFSQGTRFFKDMASKLAESRLVFNKSLNGDINMRFFEAICSGSALLTDRNVNLAELGFRDELDYIGYDSIEEMKDKATFYLKHDDLRERIASDGMQFVHDNHTYEHRAKQILETISKERVKTNV